MWNYAANLLNRPSLWSTPLTYSRSKLNGRLKYATSLWTNSKQAMNWETVQLAYTPNTLECSSICQHWTNSTLIIQQTAWPKARYLVSSMLHPSPIQSATRSLTTEHVVYVNSSSSCSTGQQSVDTRWPLVSSSWVTYSTLTGLQTCFMENVNTNAKCKGTSFKLLDGNSVCDKQRIRHKTRCVAQICSVS